ncbi:transposase [Streptomyces sp. NPDC051020]|uniref:transposase n=1 Tax=Streptomyces sp. NPDC051020 TaxID=3155409 RepID=UPI00343B30C2
MKLATSSPERQRENVLTAAASVGAHIIGWADDWEVSGATDPVTRPKLGPWLRDERGPYDGLVAAAVDRLGRNVVDCLNTGYKMRDEKKMLVTYGHDGPWELDDPADENRFTMEAWGAQMELRAIQRRNRDATIKIRAVGRPKGKPSYGFQYVRKVMRGKVDHVELHPHASEVIRDVARRILADPENVTTSSEAARLNRAGEVRFPRDAEDVDRGSDGLMRGTSTMAAPRKYPLELRERAVRMYRTTEPKPQIKRLAIDLGVHPEALRGWIRQAEADAGERDDRLTTDERAELAALRKENTQLKRANEVLRTASAFFAAQLDPTRPR